MSGQNPTGDLQEYPPSGSAAGNIDLKGFQLLDSTQPVTLPASESIQFAGRTIISSPADGQLLLTEADGAGFSRLYFGGTGSGNCYIVQNTTDFIFRSSTTDSVTGVSMGQITFANSTFRALQANQSGAGTTLGSTGQYCWSDNVLGSSGSINLGLARDGANGLLRVSDGSTGIGATRTKQNRQTITTGTTTLTALMSGDIITNDAAATLVLPVPTAGVIFYIGIGHVGGITLQRQTSGDIYVGGTADVEWVSTDTGASMVIWCDGTNWMTVTSGSWTT